MNNSALTILPLAMALATSALSTSLVMASETQRPMSTSTYCVIDLSAGPNATSYPIACIDEPPSDGFNTDEYKTTKLVLRRIEPGAFIMAGKYKTSLTKPYYIGVFEMTQRQYQLVMGANPSQHTGDMRPVEKVSYNTIRGSANGANWPMSSDVDQTSFMGKLRARTGLEFDLPTEAQWEYACRAGTTSAYNNGGNAEDDLKLLGRYSGNKDDGKGGYSSYHTKVGSYLPNAWGLYDMHGNIKEWCRDWDGTIESYGRDPVGALSGTRRALRGGACYSIVSYCTSSNRDREYPETGNYGFGFRLSCMSTEPMTWYVDGASGNDSNRGTSWQDAKKTIQDALLSAMDGDVVLVKPGVYAKLRNERGVNVLVKSLNGPVGTVIDSERSVRAVTGMPSDLWSEWKERHITLDGFTIQNGREYSASAAAYVFLRNCIIRNNLATNSSIVDFVNMEGCLIVDNVCSNNLLVYRSSMVNCTMAGNRIVNHTAGAAIGKAAITNCVIFEADCGSASVISQDSTVAYSCLDEPNSGEGNIVSSIGAVFADAALSDYHLAANSPCIETGLTDGVDLPSDLDGNQRVRGFRVDMGCYESLNANPTTWYVDGATGDDSNGGYSWQTAKRTIQNALDLAMDGDVILVNPGVYKETAEVIGGLYNRRGIVATVRSTEGPLVTAIDGDGKRRAIKGTASETQNDWTNHVITVEGFTIQNGCHNGPSAAAWCKFLNCIFRDNVARDRELFRSVELENCLVIGNTVSNINSSASSLMAEQSKIKNSTFYNNLIINSSAGALFSDNTIISSIICGNTGGGALFSQSCSVSYTCADLPVSGTGNIVSSHDAIFANAANGDCRLAVNSPCIEAGAPDSQALEFDLDGNPRLKGRFVDMGCYEFQSPFPALPIITPSGGVAASWPLSIAMSCETDGATIHYTTDGSEPTTDSPIYRRFRISGRTTVKAVAEKYGLLSDVAVAEYALGQCADPVVSPVGNAFFEHSGQSVSIAWQGEDGVLRYTTDGSDPTADSPVYAGPFTIDDSTIVKAKAFGDQFFDSAVVTANLTRVWVNVATPTITAASSFTGAETKVALSCATPGTTIRYTLNGNDPNSHSTRYTGPFYVAESCTVKAYATCHDYLDSAVATQSIEKVWGIGDTMGAPDHAFSTETDHPFVRVTDTTAPLGESMKSGAITHSQTSTLSTTVMGPGTISFQWKTSCEKDPDDFYEWDHAAFTVDGTVVAKLDGESGWQTFSHAIADDGEHTLEWRYVKDNVESEGEDCCWVAGYHWVSAYTATQTTPAPVPYVWLRGHFPHTPDEYDAYESAAKKDAANGLNTVWECYVAGLGPTDAADVFRTVISMDGEGNPVITWEPDLNEGGTKQERVYTVEGRESLTDGVWGPTNAASRFFRVKVGMP